MPHTPPDLAPLGEAHVREGEFTLCVDGARPLSADLVKEIDAYCDRLEDRSPSQARSSFRPEPESRAGAVAVLRLHGGGAAQWPGAGTTIDLVSRWEKALRRLERAEAATVAVVEGLCTGPALEVLLTADYRVADAAAAFCLPVAGSGVWTGMSLHRLATRLGPAHARRLALFGAEFSAAEALELRLVDVVETDPWTHAADRAARFAALLPDELAIRRRLVMDASATGFDEALGRHLAACHRTLLRVADAEPEQAR